MKLITEIADRMLGLLVPHATAAAACPGCGSPNTSCQEVQYQTCSLIGGGTGVRVRRRTCYWGANCYKSCSAWGPWSLCMTQ